MQVYLILILAIIIGQIVKIPFGQGGFTILDITIVVLSLTLIPSKIKSLKLPTYLKTGLFFSLMALLSLLFTPLLLSTNELINSAAYLVRFVLILVFCFLFSLKHHAKIISVLTFSGIGLGVVGLLQFILIPNLLFLEGLGWDPHYFRTVSSFLDPNFVGAYFVLTLLLILAQPFSKKHKQLLFIFVFLALLTTFSRGAYLMFGVSFLSLALLNKSFKIFILTVALVAILLISFSVYQKYVATPRNIDREKSATYRVNSWQQGWELFTKSQVFGVGFNTYRYALRDYNLGNEQFLQTRGSTSNDSSLLFVLATTGVTGLLSYVTFIATIWILGWKSYLKNKSNSTVLLSGLTGLIVQSFFTNSLFYPFIFLWIILLASYLDQSF